MKSLSKYQIIREIGHGGGGCVYQAFDLDSERKVALKILTDRRAFSDHLKARFVREARVASMLSHHNLTSIYESGEDESGRPYMVMEYLPGQDLLTRLAMPPALTLAGKLDIMLQICAGIKAIHAKNIVHRDIKPSNIQLLPDGQVKIMDFGIAKSLDQKSDLTVGTIGTVGYMSPEQLEGHPVDTRTDIFAVGVLFYELITGRRPFRSPSLSDMVDMVVNGTPSSIDPRLIESLPGIDSIIGKCLEKDPANRYRSIEEVAEAIESLETDEQAPLNTFTAMLEDDATVEQNNQPENWTVASTRARRSRFALIAIALLFLTLAAVAGFQMFTGGAYSI